MWEKANTSFYTNRKYDPRKCESKERVIGICLFLSLFHYEQGMAQTGWSKKLLRFLIAFLVQTLSHLEPAPTKVYFDHFRSTAVSKEELP